MADYYRFFSSMLILESEAERTWCKNRYQELRLLEDPDSGGSKADFNGEIDGGGFWIQDNGEYGNVDQVVDFVQEFLRKFDKQTIWTMEWANTCSKRRLDAFGGGAVAVTSEKIQWMHTSSWVTDVVQKFSKLKGPKNK